VPVGMLDPAPFIVETTALRPRDKLIVFSDGLTEAANEDGEYFDTDRLLDTARAGAALSCVQLHAFVLEAVREFTGGMAQQDDLTLVVAEYIP